MKKRLLLLVGAILAVSAVANADVLTDGFEFHGYARTGVFIDQDAYKSNTIFQADGARAKYRLGNESTFYSEAELVKKFSTGDADASFHYMLAFSSENLNSWTDIDVATRQLYADITPNGGPTYWVGKRFYGREDIHITDYYFKDFSGTGAGATGIKVGNGSLDLALITTSPVEDFTSPVTGQNYRVSPEYTLHSKYYTGPWTFELATHYIRNASKMFEDGTTYGLQGAVNYNLPGFYGYAGNGFSKVVLQVGHGLGANNGLGGAAAWGGARKDALSVQLLTFGQSNLSDSLQVMPVLGYRYDSNAEKDVDTNWITAGIRLVNPITKHFAMQYEAGVDYVMAKEKGSSSVDSGLAKLTVAPTLKLDTSNFWGRPELRAFVTYGQGFGDGKYVRVNDRGEDKSSGLNMGVQAEIWF